MFDVRVLPRTRDLMHTRIGWLQFIIINADDFQNMKH